MLLGKRVLGEKGAALERLKQEGVNKGVGLGKRVIKNDPTLSKILKDNNRPVAASGNRTARRAKPKAAPAPQAVGYSETEVEQMLAENPNVWEKVLDAEAKRPDGARQAVAALLLAVADKATDNPIPEVILTELAVIAGAEE